MTVLSPKRECHRCPLNGSGDDYCWKKCRGPAENSRKGRNIVSLDAMPAAAEYIENNIDRLAQSERSPAEATGTVDSIDFETERRLVQILAAMMSLSDMQLCIFRHIYFGEKMETVGESLPVRISKQAVSKHIQVMRAKHPVIDRMFKQALETRLSGFTTPKQDAGKKKHPVFMPAGATMQLDLFSGVSIGGIYKRAGHRKPRQAYGT